MQQCPNCGHPNRAGVVFCENCGASLIGKMPLDTKSLNTTSSTEKSEIDVDSSVVTDVKVQGVSTFSPGDELKLEIEGSPEPIVLEPKAEAIFGRRDPATGAMPDIDLTPFAGYRMGVSRRHAAIRRNDEQSLDVWDLGSSNGTFLNGQRLSAHRPYRLHNGDELRLGQMIIRVAFQTPAGEKKKDLDNDTAGDNAKVDPGQTDAKTSTVEEAPQIPKTLPISSLMQTIAPPGDAVGEKEKAQQAATNATDDATQPAEASAETGKKTDDAQQAVKPIGGAKPPAPPDSPAENAEGTDDSETTGEPQQPRSTDEKRD